MSSVFISILLVLAPAGAWRFNAPTPVRINSHSDLLRHLGRGESLSQLDVRGNVALPAGRGFGDHEVGRALLERRARGYGAGECDDGHRIALAIEGGGMRGSVGAGMAAALLSLGFGDCFDDVYGASAGALVGAGFVAAAGGGKPSWRSGCSVYYDMLTGTSRRFIDTQMLPRALGLGILRQSLLHSTHLTHFPFCFSNLSAADLWPFTG